MRTPEYAKHLQKQIDTADEQIAKILKKMGSRTCPYCDGGGLVYAYDGNTPPIDCENCDGSGTV